MISSFVSPQRVPETAVTRLLKNVRDLLAATEGVLASIDPADPARTGLQKTADVLQGVEVRLLQDADEFRAGNRQPLLLHAADIRLLARHMDGLTVTSAAESTVSGFLQTRQLLVLTAWQIVAAASGSEAAGL